MHDAKAVAALAAKAEVYARTELPLQDPRRELTHAQASLLRAGIYCGIAAVFDELSLQEEAGDG